MTQREEREDALLVVMLWVTIPILLTSVLIIGFVSVQLGLIFMIGSFVVLALLGARAGADS